VKCKKIIINKMLDAGKDGFEGGLTARKYVSTDKVSRATAGGEAIVNGPGPESSKLC